MQVNQLTRIGGRLAVVVLETQLFAISINHTRYRQIDGCEVLIIVPSVRVAHIK